MLVHINVTYVIRSMLYFPSPICSWWIDLTSQSARIVLCLSYLSVVSLWRQLSVYHTSILANMAITVAPYHNDCNHGRKAFAIGEFHRHSTWLVPIWYYRLLPAIVCLNILTIVCSTDAGWLGSCVTSGAQSIESAGKTIVLVEITERLSRLDLLLTFFAQVGVTSLAVIVPCIWVGVCMLQPLS